MKSTMDLLDMAFSEEYKGISAAEWCRQLGVNRTALAVSKARGRLSPTVAGNLARLLGEPVQKWIAIAALEAEPNTYGKSKLMTMINQWGKQITSVYLSLAGRFQRPLFSAL